MSKSLPDGSPKACEHVCGQRRDGGFSMARGEIRKESKGRKSEKSSKEKMSQQPAYVAAEVISRKKDKDR